MRQQAAQRTGTEVRVEALVGQCRQRIIVHVSEILICFSRRSLRLLSMIAAMFLTCSFLRALNTMISSTRLRNSGRK